MFKGIRGKSKINRAIMFSRSCEELLKVLNNLKVKVEQ
jgi:hypothetical protein